MFILKMEKKDLVYLLLNQQVAALVALKDIDKDEELCFDYDFECWKNDNA